MHQPDSKADSKIADLLPRIVERAARRSDEKEEEPWVKPRKDAGVTDPAKPAAGLPAGVGALLVGILLLPSLLAFAVTGIVAADDYSLTDAGQHVVLHCVGAPLVHTVRISGLGDDSQFFPGAMLVNALMWIAVTAAIWWCLHLGVRVFLDYRQSGKRKFTIGQMLAVSVGIAMALSAWRWDLAADAAPWQATLKETQIAFEQHRPAGPAVQPLMRFSVLAAAYAYLGVGCAGLCLVSGGLWIIRQFLPRRPGEDKSLLQQIF